VKKKSLADRAKRSSSYIKAKIKADEYLKSPQKLKKLIKDAEEKAKSRRGPLGEIWENLQACFRLVNAYAKGEYHEIPWSSIAMIVASIVYFVMPLDLLPDFILGIGLLDDAALIAWTVRTISSDIEKFIEWEDARAENNPDDEGP